MPRRTRRTVGRPALFSRRFGVKIREPISITLAPRHHRMVDRAKRRLGISRSDLVALLIEKFADRVALPPRV